MNRVAKLAYFWVKLVFSLAAFAAAVYVIFYYSYLWGHEILDARGVGQGDIPRHMSWINTLQRYFPKVPLWLPTGGGFSIVLGYWVLPHYLAIVGDYFSNLTVEQWVRLLVFLSVPITAVEIYLYLWIRLKNQVIATLGALLYPLSSVAAWGWMVHAGFYGTQLATATILPPFLFFDLYLEEELNHPERTTRKRLFLLGFSLTLPLAILMHGSVMPSLFLGLPLYTLLRSQLSPRRSEKRILSFFRAFKAASICLIFGLLASSFFLLPQMRYLSFQGQGQIFGHGATSIGQLPWRGFLGFERLPIEVGDLYTPLFMSFLVTAFGLVGIVFALLRRNFLAALGITALFYVGWISSSQFLLQNFSFLGPFLDPTNVRAVAVPTIFLTILAAYGLWSLSDIPGAVLRFVGRRLGKIPEMVFGKLSLLLSTVLVVVLSILAFYNFRSLQTYPTEQIPTELEGLTVVYRAYPGYGPSDLRAPFCMVPGWEDEVSQEACEDSKPKFVVEKADWDLAPYLSEDEDIKALDLGKLTRVSISPHLGGLTFSFAGNVEASVVSVPLATPLNAWVGLHDDPFFLQAAEPTPEEVAEVAKWFGVRYVFLHPEQDESVFYRFPEDKWPIVATPGPVVREFKESPGPATFSTKPAVLMIGAEEKRAYTDVLRITTKGGFSFERALLVQGTPNIDDYSLEELKKFSTIVLHGYSYRKHQKAWGLLKRFVEEGGTLFIDTGWQFVAKDWGKGPDKEGDFLEIELPEPSPVKKTLWGNIGTSWDGAFLNTEIGEGLDFAEFASPSWGDLPWEMALAKIGDLRPWAEPILTSGDKVIIAKGNFGKGKVVWSGMNLFAHAYGFESSEEYRLIGNVFNFLLPRGAIEEGEVLVNWESPERIEFSFSKVPQKPAFLYWAYSYAPGWKAYLLKDGEREDLKIYRAGPGFKAVRLEELSGGEKLVLEYSLKRVFLASFGITFLTLAGLLALIFDALFLNRFMERKVTRRLFGRDSLSLGELWESLRKKISGAVRWEEED